MIFIDFEVTKFDWLCVAIKPDDKSVTHIVNDPEMLKIYYEENKHDIWVGHNIKGYDQYILQGILCGFDPYKINNFIIQEHNKGYQFSSQLKRFPLIVYDTMTDRVSLKVLESYLNLRIKETDIPFDIDRKLTEDELKLMREYCEYDVWSCMEVFCIRKKNEFDAMMSLVKTFNLPITDLSKTKAQLSAKILGAVKTEHDDEWDLQIPDVIQLGEYEWIRDWFMNPLNQNNEANLSVTINGVEHSFGWGGIHGAIPQYQKTGLFVNVDVTSYYPSLMIQWNLLSRNVQDPNKFKGIYDTRVAYKKAHDPRVGAYKIVLNSTYGASNDKYNNLYDPRQAHSICVTGQLMLLDLELKLMQHCEIVQCNTDGILLRLYDEKDFDVVDDICYEWECRTHMGLEFDYAKLVKQKDVNNYIMVCEDGHTKSKGAYVKELSVLDNDLPIVNKAVMDYLTNNTSVENTIKSAEFLKDFSRTVKVSSNYLYAVYKPKIEKKKGQFYFTGGQKQMDKVFRVFASLDNNDGGLYKVSGKQTSYGDKNPEKFATTPDRCKIVNDDIQQTKIPNWLDKEWYIQLARERLRDFGCTEVM